MIVVRPEQELIASYKQGKMGISAVPGSGKTWTLSYLAANLLRRGVLNSDQEILIVTLVNSAVDNFYHRINSFVTEYGLLPGIGYRVRTLHGLAHDIVRERPELVGLDNNFVILDEHDASSILNDITLAWVRAHYDVIEPYLNSELDNSKIEWVRRNQVPSMIRDIANSFIRSAKDLRLPPVDIRKILTLLPIPLQLAEMGCDIYESYQDSLAYRGAVDFDDLIRLALQAIDSDAMLLERLHNLWPFILEDEAQDSSRLQEQILRRLTNPDGNWVRVGDPNQAIYETFTTANPKYLRNFLKEADVTARDLPVSGRSTSGIIRLANYLVEWAQSQHPFVDARSALVAPPWITETSPDDPQPNPEDKYTQIHLINTKYSPDGEVQAVIKSLKKWMAEHPDDQTLAVLVPLSKRGKELISAMEKEGIPYNDSLLGSTKPTRSLTSALNHLLRYLADPQSSSKLSEAYRVWRRIDRLNQDERKNVEQTASLLHKLTHVEDFIWPSSHGDWLEQSGIQESDNHLYEQLRTFRFLIQRWHQATILPIDQIILTLSQDLFTEAGELAIAHKLAGILHQQWLRRPELKLPELANELLIIARNERRFLGFSEDEGGFDPDRYKGIVVVATMHKAKGLQWDRVYLMSVNNYDFPSGSAYDSFRSEKYYIRDNLNLEAEALAQFMTALSSSENEWYVEGDATREARIDYIQERLRLLYVGITRAKKELIITWNTGSNPNIVMRQAIPFIALQNFMESQSQETQ